jgi:hypothetical protein
MRLQKRLDSGEASLEWHERHGYLRAVLRGLYIPMTSQTLVFSKTSLQRSFISPRTPRAVYFNETSHVTWLQDAPLLEISGTDPRWGGTFYTLRQERTTRTRFQRETFECIRLTGDVPGPRVGSVYAWADGMPELGSGSFVTTDRSPISERWGGWFVTGTHGRQHHM